MACAFVIGGVHIESTHPTFQGRHTQTCGKISFSRVFLGGGSGVHVCHGGCAHRIRNCILEASYSRIWQTNGSVLSGLSLGLFPWPLSLVSFLGFFSFAVDIWPFTFVAHTGQWRESKRQIVV